MTAIDARSGNHGFTKLSGGSYAGGSDDLASAVPSLALVVYAGDAPVSSLNEALELADADYVALIDERLAPVPALQPGRAVPAACAIELNGEEQAASKPDIPGSAILPSEKAIELGILESETTEQLLAKCATCNLDMLAFGSKGTGLEICGLFTGQQFFVKTQTHSSEYRPQCWPPFLRTMFLRDNGIRFEENAAVSSMLFGLECIALAKRVMADENPFRLAGTADGLAVEKPILAGKTTSAAKAACAVGTASHVREIAKFLGQRNIEMDGGFRKCLSRRLFDMLVRAQESIWNLDEPTMFQFAGTMDFASGFDLFLMRNTIARWKFEEQVDARDEQIDELQNSTSMKLGKILTAPMRKIKGGSGGRSNSTDGAGTQSTAGTANAENATNTASATNIASSTSSGATSSTSSIATNTARPGVTFAKRSPQVIASFTSYPMRLDTIAPSVESLAGQTRKFDRIVLWLSRSQFPDGKLPAGMGRLFDMGLEIMWCDEDVRSYKRSVCSFEAFPEDILVFFDDDLIYREDSLETLLHSYEAHPNAVNALRVRRMQFDAKGALLPYSTWEVAHDQHVGEARMDLLATNGAGTLYPPHLMPDETLNAAKFMQLAPTADDIWLKFMQTIAGIPVVLAREFEELQYTEGTQEVCALWDDNEHLDLNDAAVAKLLEEYDQIHGADDTLLMRMRGSRA